MQNRYVQWLILAVVVLLPLGWIAWPTNTNLYIPLPFESPPITRNIAIRQGLDLQGGLQVLLEADLPADQTIDASAMEAAKTIVENRVNSLGVTEPVVQIAGTRRIVVELPGLSNTEQALSLLRQTGLLEFVDTGTQAMPEGQVIQTDHVLGSTTPGNTTPTAAPTEGATTAAATLAPTSETSETSEGTAAAGASGTAASTLAATAASEATATAIAAASTTPTGPVYHTLMTGSALQTATVETQQGGKIVVAFTLTAEGKEIFAQYTTANVGKYLTIVLDKKVLSSPVIQSAITGGSGVIEGKFSLEEANSLAINLRYGALPVPLTLAESRVIGPTLGQDSLNKSLIAGAIGFGAVVIFMLLYYRLPGLVAIVSILAYASIALATFKLIPVTLTLAGVAGFLLSTGSALDANILIFERLKEELRSGRNLSNAMEIAWQRAWSSIRDSNIATVIICLILLWFASTFGATVVRGFAVTLLIGVVISLITALFFTRALLNTVLLVFKPTNQRRWFGI